MSLSQKTLKMVIFALGQVIDRIEKQQLKNKHPIVNKIDGSVRKALKKAYKEISEYRQVHDSHIKSTRGKKCT